MAATFRRNDAQGTSAAIATGPNQKLPQHSTQEGFLQRCQILGSEVAGRWADEADRDARLPLESIEAMRGLRLLGAMLPETMGGAGTTTAELASGIAAISECCASSGLVLAMHQIQVASLLRHRKSSDIEDFLKEVAADQLLLASANSEVGLAGDRRRSIAALEELPGGGFRLVKDASAVSYGLAADAIVATARRHPNAAPGDQVLAVLRPPKLQLRQIGGWDAFGMRATCSVALHIEAELPPGMVIDSYEEVFARTARAVSTIFLAAVWLGIAEAAAKKAHRFVRNLAKQSPGATPPSALKLAELAGRLQQLRQVIESAIAQYESTKDGPEILTFAAGASMDMNKVAASRLAVEVVERALEICGIAGYANNSPYSIGRLLRDVHSASLMISNDRIMHDVAHSLLVRKRL